MNRRGFVTGLIITSMAINGCSEAASDSPAAEAGGEERWAAVQAFVRRRTEMGQFRGSVLVAKDGKVVLSEGYGLADDAGAANSPQTLFCIASLGKMFTAVAIGQLAQNGRLSFTDTIGRHVPGFPREVADSVSVHHLLTHTSGMGDVLRTGPDLQPPSTIDAMMRLIVKTPLQFTPGSQFAYSNSGFVVLGAIVEQITGMPYARYITDKVFTPAGMAHTGIKSYTPSAVEGMAHGFVHVDANGNLIRIGPAGPGGTAGPTGPAGAGNAPDGQLRDNGGRSQVASPAGGAYSSVTDLVLFAQALLSDKLLSAAMTTILLTGKVEDNRPGGSPDDRYAYGFSDQRVNGVRIVGHNGGTPGYEGQLDIYPDEGYVMAVLTNQDDVLLPVIRRSEQLLSA